jgi:hypothetical protein
MKELIACISPLGLGFRGVSVFAGRCPALLMAALAGLGLRGALAGRSVVFIVPIVPIVP